MYHKSLALEFRKGKKGAAQFISNTSDICAIATACFSTMGLMSDADGTTGVTIAVLMGILTGVLFAALWRIVCHLISSDVSRKTRAYIMVAAFAMAPFLFSVSTTLNVKAIAQTHAKALYTEQYISQAETVTSDLFSYSQTLQGLLPDLRSAISTFDQAAQNELRTGQFSGARGTGSVHVTLTRITNNLRDIESSIVEAGKVVMQEQQNAESLLQDMRVVMQSDIPVNHKVHNIADLATKLASVHALMNKQVIGESAYRLVRNLPLETNLISEYSINPRVRASQQEALKKLAVYLKETNLSLENSLSEFIETPAPALAPFERVSGNKAIMVMWHQIPAFWAAGLAIDFMMYFVVIYLWISANSKTAMQHRIESARALSAEELLFAKDVYEALRLHQLHPDDAELLLSQYRKPLQNERDDGEE